MNPNLVYLTQTDTTVGFLSRDYKKLNKIKKRDISKKVLMEVDSLKTLKKFTRVPKKYRKFVRNAKKTTFIYPNKKSFRVIKDERHLKFLKKFSYLYSTSANLTSKSFDKEWAFKKADVIVGNVFYEGRASTIIKLGKNRCKKLR